MKHFYPIDNIRCEDGQSIAHSKCGQNKINMKYLMDIPVGQFNKPPVGEKCPLCYSLENTQTLQKTPKDNQKMLDSLEIVKDSQYKDIENCVRFSFSIYPDSNSRTIAALRDILEGTWVSYQKSPDSEILQKVQFPAVDSLSCAQIRAKINTQAFMVALYLPEGREKDAIIESLDSEFIALYILRKFFAQPDSSKVQ